MTSPVDAESYYRTVRDASSDYQETVLTLLGFAAFVCHDSRQMRPGSNYGIGRTMSRVQTPGTVHLDDVTPDLVAQRALEYGIVAEVKKSMPRNQEYWEEVQKQLLRYSPKLIGWWTAAEEIATQDIALLIHQSRGRAFSEFLESARRANPASVPVNCAVIEFNRSDEGQPHVFFRKEWGTFQDPSMEQVLHTGRQVPMEKVLLSFPAIRFYDAPPPLEEMMKTLWVDSFPSRVGTQDRNPDTGAIDISVTVQEITEELRQAFGSGALPSDERSVGFPKTDWVRDALEAFRQSGLATLMPDGSYVIHFRYFQQGKHKDLLERFSRLRFARRGATTLPRGASTPPGQLDLLNEEGGDR